MAASYIKIGGDLLKDAVLEVVEVTQELNRHWWCTIECRQTEDQRFAIEDFLGQDLQVLTRDQDDAERTVFDGFVLDVELEYEIFGSYTARITGVTRSYLMDLTPRQAYYLDKNMEDVANTMVGRASLQLNIAYTEQPPRDYVQWGETDFEFLKRLADDHDCWIRPTAEGLDIYNAFQQESTKVQWRGESGDKGLLSFKVSGRLSQPSFNGAHYHPPSMESRTFTGVSEEASFYSSVSPMVDAVKQASQEKMLSGYVPSRSRATDLDNYEQILKGESVRSIGSKILGFGVSKNSELLPGNELEIEGVLDAHGTYGIVKVTHRWTAAGYSNEFVCTPWQTYKNSEPPPQKMFFGLTPARVAANNDPDGRGRIKVQYFWQEDGQSEWARMMTPHAGADRGFYFMPEVGDEVLVAFQEGDPERPVVLGCLWNGVDRAPTEEFWGDEHGNDDVKRIVTKSGHRIQLVDKEGKESIVIATPNYLKISLIENTDETGRSMITLHSENGDIFFSAPNGRVHFHSKYFSREVG
ncbi:MAG: phage baseplate assembly protein V [Acidobacteriota bacterium]